MSYLPTGDTGQYSVVEGGCTGATSPKTGYCCWDNLGRHPVDKSLCGAKDSQSTADKILGWLGTGFNVYAQGQQNQGIIKAGQASMSTSGTPGWLLPVGIGVAALGLVLVISKRKKAA